MHGIDDDVYSFQFCDVSFIFDVILIEMESPKQMPRYTHINTDTCT